MTKVLRATHGGFVVMLAFGGLVACGGEAPPPATPVTPPPPVSSAPPATAPAPAAAPAASAEATPPPAPPAHEHHGHGMAGMFMAELDKLQLKPEQKTAVEGIEADMKKAHEAPEASRQKLIADTADGVAAGKVDHKKTDADVKALVASVTATTPSVQDAMNRLYKTLDADQRKQLIEDLREKGKAMHEGMGHEHAEGDKKAHEGEHGKDHEHAEGAEHGKGHEHEHAEADHKEHEGAGRGGGRMKKLAEELGLTPDQRKKLAMQLRDKMKAQRTAMKSKAEAGMKHMMALGDAFEGDKFDAKKAGVGAQAPEMAKDMATGRLAMVETILAVLTPEQRAKFAEQIRAHAADEDEEAMDGDADDLDEAEAAK